MANDTSLGSAAIYRRYTMDLPDPAARAEALGAGGAHRGDGAW